MEPETLTIRDLETLQTLSEPIRFRIFQTVNHLNTSGEPCTVKKLARELGIPPGKLYYHVNLLVEHGLLLISETRLVSGIMEKLYRVAAPEIVVDRNLLSPVEGGTAEARETLSRMAAGIFKSILADFESANDVLQPPAPAQLLGKESLYLTKAQAERIQVVISQLIQEIKNQENSPDEPQSPYTFAFAFYPSPHSQPRSKETV